MLWKPYPSHHNGLFSPLLVLRGFAASRTIPELSETVRNLSYNYVTLSFLCNIICLPNFRVCVFISDPFRGHNILATKNSNEKRDSPTSKRGKSHNILAKIHPNTKEIPNYKLLKIYNKVPAYNEPNKIFFKQLRGIKLYKRRSVSDSEY